MHNTKHFLSKYAMFIVIFYGIAIMAEEKTIKVVTYNISALPSYITGNNTLGRMREISTHLRGFNIVAIQEVFENRFYSMLSYYVDYRYKLRFHKKDPKGIFKIYGSGLAIFTTLEVVGYYKEYYKSCHGILLHRHDCLATKGFQIIRIILDGVEVDIYNTHMEAGNTGSDFKVLALQVSRLIEIVKKFSNQRPVIFLGDTNLGFATQERNLLRKFLSRTGLRDACRESNCRHNIDKVLYRSSKRLKFVVKSWKKEKLRDKNGEMLSDHDPVVVELFWFLPEKKLAIKKF